MRETEAREIISRVGSNDPPLEKLNKLSDMGSIYPYAQGYLEALEKARVLEEALRDILATCAGAKEYGACECECDRAEKALAQYRKEK